MRRWQRCAGSVCAAFAMALSLSAVGCEKKEKILDIKTPGGGIEIEKSRKGIEIDVEKNGRDSSGTNIRIETDEKDRKQ